ncbi:MAG: hypothetical protein HOV81_35640 [Kofleriaceae bacterium]|nr:hypothetical protein [Kofleriaceae bacterium]
MTLFEDVSRLARLGLVLKLRDTTLAPALQAAAVAARTSDLLVGASAQSSTFELVLPYHRDALHALAPTQPPPEKPAERIRARVEGENLFVLLADAGPFDVRAAALAAPAAHREAWLDLVEQLCSIAGGRVTGVSRAIDGSRAQLEVRYPARDKATEAMLIEAITQLGEGIGVTDAQRRLWTRLHPQLSRGGEIVVSTGCGQGGVSGTFGITYPIASWQTAVRLAEGLVLNDSEAKEVPRRLGELAGAMAADELSGVELVLGPHEPADVLVWARIAPR